ncbi:hypothetical protein P8452_55131 [Trifolium repens]|nr:hypothetical protein P8452_55131 [Trifolium repens]
MFLLPVACCFCCSLLGGNRYVMEEMKGGGVCDSAEMDVVVVVACCFCCSLLGGNRSVMEEMKGGDGSPDLVPCLWF